MVLYQTLSAGGIELTVTLAIDATGETFIEASCNGTTLTKHMGVSYLGRAKIERMVLRGEEEGRMADWDRKTLATLPVSRQIYSVTIH